MTLNPITNFPTTRRYVLKLHRDADYRQSMRGRLENMSTGRQYDFNSAAELLNYLKQDLLTKKESEL